MKIAIIERNFMGSTAPLVKRLLDKGINVDLYLLTDKKIDFVEASQMAPVKVSYGVSVLDKRQLGTLNNYFNSHCLRVFTIACPRPFATVPVLRNFVLLYIKRLLRKAAIKINKERYDAINFIGIHKENYVHYLLSSLNTKVIVSLHEVCDHLHPQFQHPPIIIKNIVQKGYSTITFSKKSALDLYKYEDITPGYNHVLPFGLFESYRYIPETRLDLPPKYILFYGTFLPYKGISVLCEAVKKHLNQVPDLKIVFAGSGHNNDVELVKDDPRFVVINKYLSNAEIVTLIKHCHCVVCPYLSASQSGIPQTTYVFDKPLIASDINSFKDIIIDGVDGLMFRCNDVADLAKKIKDIWTSDDLHKKLCSNVANFETLHPEYSWDNIVEKYINLFNKK